MAENQENSRCAIDEWLEWSEDFARREPAKAMLSGFAAGLVLNLLPLSAIASALVSIAFSFVRPALLFLGMLKACELSRAHFNGNQPSHSTKP